MAASLPEPRYTMQEYLTLERQAAYKSEYIDGFIVAMAGASREHVRINSNITTILNQQLRDRECDVFPSDMRVKIEKANIYTYPDIVIVCGEARYEDAAVDTLLNPTVIIEILSRSTESYDRGAKFGYYRGVPSLQEYILVAQDRSLIEQYVRDGERWIFEAASAEDTTVQLPSIGCELPLQEVYRRVIFAEPEPLEKMGIFKMGQEEAGR